MKELEKKNINMKLQEQINRIQSMMGVINEKINRFQLRDDERYKSCSMSDITRMEIIDNFLRMVQEDPNYNIEKQDCSGFHRLQSRNLQNFLKGYPWHFVI